MPSMEMRIPPLAWTWASHSTHLSGEASCLQQRTVRIKQIQHFPTRDGQPEGDQALQQCLIDFIEGLMLREPQMAHQNHDIDPKGEPRQRQRVGCRTAIAAPMAGTRLIGASVSAMDELQRTIQRNYASFR